MKFSPQQSSAIDAVARWYRDRQSPVFRLFGYAGTGKTTLAKELAASVKGNVQYGAFTGKAAMVMRKNGCPGSATIHRTIYSFSENEETGKMKFRLKPRFELENTKLFVIDECSMVDEKLAKDLMSFDIPILVLGDPAQLPPVRGSGYFTDAEPDAMLTEIHRQAAENPIVRLATDVREGRKLHIGDYGLAKIVSTDDLQQSMVTEADQVLVGTNKKRANFNRRLRELAGRSGEMPVVGDQLVALKNDTPTGIFNGSLWQVIEVKQRRTAALNDHCIHMMVKSLDFEGARPVDVRVREEFFLGRGDEVPFTERRGTQEFDYGYALTVHKSQGSQWPHVCLFDESSAFREGRERWLYTGITRAAEQLTIVV